MNFNSWDLKHQPCGAIVEVTLSGNAANARLFDSSNFSSFKAGRRATGYGGQATRSPVRLQVPRSGHWYLVIDYGGVRGRGRASVQVLPGALPELRQRSMPTLDRLAESVAALNHVDNELISKQSPRSPPDTSPPATGYARHRSCSDCPMWSSGSD